MRRTLILLAACAGGAAHADETRQLGAHEHGASMLNIAVEGDQLMMELEAPGADIVGFEHPATSAEDEAAIERAMATLEQPGELFVFPEAAGCELVEASVELIGDDEHGHDEHGDEEHGEEHAEGEAHGDEMHAEGEEHAEGDAHGGHTEFHATYTMSCDDPAQIAEIRFPYFETFPNAEEIDLQVAAAGGGGAFEIERDDPVVDLGGMM